MNSPQSRIRQLGALVGRSVPLVVCCLALQGCGGSSGTAPDVEPAERGGRMRCGAGVKLCGLLTLESGLGKGPYRHSEPVVHGLWPEVGSFGDSQCIVPKDGRSPKEVYSCYRQSGERMSDLLRFQAHEWEKHGMCAGTQSAADYFSQVCNLSAGPLKVLANARLSGSSFGLMVSTLRAAGYPVFSSNALTSEVHLSACASTSGRWVLAPMEKFQQYCGIGTAPAPSVPSPAPTLLPAPVDVCVPGEFGPRCSADFQCAGVAGCIRCATSGYCTDEPLSPMPAPACVPGEHGPACRVNADCQDVAGCRRCARSGFCTDQPLLRKLTG